MAIITGSSKVLASVEAIGQLKQGQYGEYRSILFTRYDIEGESSKVWKSMKPSDAAQFTKGQQVYLIPAKRDNKDTWDVEVIDAATPLPNEQLARTSGELTVAQKREIAQYIDSRTDLLGYCFEVVNRKLAALDTDSQRAAAIELYRSTAHKFDL